MPLLFVGCDEADEFDSSTGEPENWDATQVAIDDAELPQDEIAPELEDVSELEELQQQFGGLLDFGAGANLENDLMLGDVGPEVEALYDYLYRFGYFPNADLRAEYPRWQPAVAHELDDPQVFDRSLEKAVSAYQRLMGLEATGIADEVTRALMAQPRCAHPDSDPEAVAYWDVGAPNWINDHDVTYRINARPAAYSATDFANALNTAYNRWEAVSDINFRRITSGSADQNIGLLPASSGLLAAANAVAINFHPNLTLSLANLRAVAVHEIGHTLGIPHSGYEQASMFPILFNDARAETLHRDDILAFETMYGSWSQITGAAHDVGIGGGQTWVVGVGSHHIWRHKGNGQWDGVGALATRIAVDSSGAPWVTQPSGMIWRRTGVSSSNRNGTGWQHVPGAASDIGAGGGQVWVVDMTPSPGGFQIWRRSGSSWSQVPGGAVRIAVDGGGAPWVVNDNGNIYRRTGVESWRPNGNGWELLPGAATDIGVGTDINATDWGTAWITSVTPSPGGFAIFVWNEQPATGNGAPPANFRRQWVQVPGGGTNVAVDQFGRPIVLNNVQDIWSWPSL